MKRDTLALARILWLGTWVHDRGRLLLTAIAIALGVALGTTVHLVNYSAGIEFEAAVRALSGDADLRIAGPRSGFDEALFAAVAGHANVAVASPVVEIDAKLAGHDRAALKIIGLDPFRALQLQPTLLGEAGEQLLDLLRPKTVMLSPAAARALGLKSGDQIGIQVGLRRIDLDIIAILPEDNARQPFALMDIASAQWALEHIGRLSRIDVRVRPGTSLPDAMKHLQALLPPGVIAQEAERESERGLSLSRAYRVNLTMLALVSLFTGAVLVFTTQSLAVLRRRTQFGLLRALGLSARTLTGLVILEAGAVGVAGTLAGLGAGIGFAHLAIAYAGADLGAGFFSGVVAQTQIDLSGLAWIAATGLFASLIGGTVPAIEAARANPAQALRAGDEQESLDALPNRWIAIVLLLTAAVLVFLPALDGLPIFGYIAIASLLLGALALMPDYVRAALAIVPKPRLSLAWLDMQQLRGTRGYVGISLAGMLASFSLVVAMLIMIHSFRHSLDAWLGVVLPADLYARAAGSASGWIDVETQRRIDSAPSVARVSYSRFDQILLDTAKPAVTLIARDLDPRSPDALPLVSPIALPRDDTIPAWISEAVREIHGLAVGDRLRLPVRGVLLEVQIAGIWRDYVRQGGAIVIPRDAYRQATQDNLASEAWIWLHDRSQSNAAIVEIRNAIGAGSELEMREPGKLRALSMAAFDRTFAVTYALQFAALVIGLFGISVGTSAQAMARRREFGVLHHLGLSLRDLRTTVAIEGGIIGALGACAGAVVGGLMSLILIHVINRQSFHWSMDVRIPWTALISIAAILACCSALVAALSVRRSLGSDIVAAVKEDW